MSDDEVLEVLTCPADDCTRQFEIFAVDPDAGLSGMVHHLRNAPHYRTTGQALTLLAQLPDKTEVGR